MDAWVWVREVAEKLERAFGERLAFVGLQGSRARGEAHAGSDIDVVVVLDAVSAADLFEYRSIVASMPESELACGFVGSLDALAAWPRHELFQFVQDTHVVYGSLDGVPCSFTWEDARDAARVGASGVYHAVCHTVVFDGGVVDDVLKSLFKGAFFTLQAIHFARTGTYVGTKKELASLLEGNDARVLAVGMDWEAMRPTSDAERSELVDLLLSWSRAIILECA